MQGSAAIVDWAAAAGAKHLTPNTRREACLEVEKRLDDGMGVHVCDYCSEALVDHSETVRPIFATDLTLFHKMLLSGTWRAVRKGMIDLMDPGPEQGQDSKRIVEGELSCLDGLLSNGRRFLVGEQFSRADMTAVSLLAPLLAPLTSPNEHPPHADLRLPRRLAADLVSWENRPSINAVREIYGQYRLVPRAVAKII